MRELVQLLAFVFGRRDDATVYADDGRPHLKISKVRVPRFLDTNN